MSVGVEISATKAAGVPVALLSLAALRGAALDAVRLVTPEVVRVAARFAFGLGSGLGRGLGSGRVTGRSSHSSAELSSGGSGKLQ